MYLETLSSRTHTVRVTTPVLTSLPGHPSFLTRFSLGHVTSMLSSHTHTQQSCKLSPPPAWLSQTLDPKPRPGTAPGFSRRPSICPVRGWKLHLRPGYRRAKVWSWQTGLGRPQKAPWSWGRTRAPAPEPGGWGLAVAARRVEAVWGCSMGRDFEVQGGSGLGRAWAADPAPPRSGAGARIAPQRVAKATGFNSFNPAGILSLPAPLLPACARRKWTVM